MFMERQSLLLLDNFGGAVYFAFESVCFLLHVS